MYKYQQFVMFNSDRSRSCLVEITAHLAVKKSDDVMTPDKIIVESKSYHVYPTYDYIDYKYYGDHKTEKYCTKASEAARVVNLFIKEKDKYNYENFTARMDTLIGYAQHELDRECEKRKFEAFQKDLEDVFLKYGATIIESEDTGYEGYHEFDIEMTTAGNTHTESLSNVVCGFKNYRNE